MRFHRARRSKPRCYRDGAAIWRREHAEEIDRRYPKILRRVGGYNLDEFADPSKPVNLAKIMVGSEGTLGVVLEAKVKLVPLPKAKAVMVITFADLLESLAAAPVILAHQPSAVEVMDKAILDHTRQNQGLDDIRNEFIDGRSGRDAVRRILRGSRGRSAAAPAGAGRGSARARVRLALSRRDRSGAAGPHLEPARSRAGAFHGDEGRREIDLVRRGHGGRAGEAERVHRAISGIAADAWNHGRHVRARFGRMPARAAGGQPEDRRRRAQVRGHRAGGGGSGAGIRRRAFGRARRRPGAQPVHAADVRRRALRGLPRDQAHLRSARDFQPGQDRGRAADHRQSALRRRVSDAAIPPTCFDSRITAGWAARWKCAAAWARAARSWPAPCARRTWRRARRRTPRAGAQMFCGSP